MVAVKAEDISDSRNGKSQSALQRNQIRVFRRPTVSTETIKRPQHRVEDVSNVPNIRVDY